MKKAINLYFTFGDTKEKLNNIKKVGFDGVILGVYNGKETMTLKEQVNYCKTIGLGISMIHCSYNEPKLNGLWINNSSDGDFAEHDYLQQINEIRDLGVKDFVIHTNGGFDTQNTPTGLERIKRLVNECEKYNINLCIENLYSASQVEYIFNNIKSKNIAFCYDSGHDNFLTPNSNLLNRYSYLLTTTHLHDNHGETDEHLTLGQGNINIPNLANELSKCNFEYLSAEVKCYNSNESQIQILTRNLEALNLLESEIKKFNS